MESESAPSSRFRELLQEVAAGVPDAADKIVSEYGVHILRAVRRRMNRGIREQFDSEDFAQAVWASFFGHLSIVSRFGSEEELAGFLCRMASNKVIDAGRRRPPTAGTAGSAGCSHRQRSSSGSRRTSPSFSAHSQSVCCGK